MDDTFILSMKKFASRKFLQKKCRIEFLEDRGRPRLSCDEPSVVARFATVIRQEAARQGATFFLVRGQTNDHQGMRPSLFRSGAGSVDTLLDAEAAFERRVVESFPNNSRFKRRPLLALLQHYGYRTSWLDVVDDLRTAVWFASHDRSPSGTQFQCTRTSGSGWLYFLAATEGYQAVNLRERHHGLSLRPQTQAGWSIHRCFGTISDLNDIVVACFEFPISERWLSTGYMVSGDFLFPPSTLDDTLRRLRGKRIDDIAKDVEGEFGLPAETLGRCS